MASNGILWVDENAGILWIGVGAVVEVVKSFLQTSRGRILFYWMGKKRKWWRP